ncbi:nuclear transport factor 2 family protein [Aquimarina rhabdastrellae]
MRILKYLAFSALSLAIFSCNNKEIRSNNDVLTKTQKDIKILLEISDLKEKIVDYTFAWDENRPEEFKNFYTEDISFQVYKPLNKELLYRVDGLQANMDSRTQLNRGLENGAIRHVLSKISVQELTESIAKTKVSYTFSLFGDVNQEALPLIISGTFNDTWIKTEDRGWLVKERIIMYDNLPSMIANIFQ